jgi:hypothetical protein
MVLLYTRNKKKFMLVIWMVCGILGSYCAIRFQFWHLRIPTTLAEHEKEGAPIYPVGAVNYLAENTFSGNMMVPFHAGSYVSWKLYPDVKVSIDSRFEAAYAPELVAEHIRFYAAHDNWRKTLNRYATDAVLVPRYSPLDNLLDQSAVSEEKESIVEWRKVYMDDGFSLFLRTERAKRFPVVDNRGKPTTAGFP